MVDLDKQFAAMADVSEEDTAYDFVIDEGSLCQNAVWCWALREIKTRTASDLE